MTRTSFYPNASTIFFIFLITPVISWSQEGQQIEEIVVTATKRTENLSDIPIAITAITTEDIEKRGLDAMGDYLPSVPGVAFQDRGPARNKVVIRGVSSGPDPAEEPTVATYFGELPLGGIQTTQQSTLNPKLFDVNRIEVLRGPQGTLYGAGSMGGTVRIIPNTPNMTQLETFGAASFNGTKGGDESYDFGGGFSIPVVPNVFAIRVGGYYYDIGGFVDNIADGDAAYDFDDGLNALGGGISMNDLGITSLGLPENAENDVGDEETWGIRVAATWTPNENFKADFSFLHQDTEVDGLQEDSTLFGNFNQRRYLDEILGDEFQIYNLILDYTHGAVNFVSSTGYLNRDSTQIRELVGFFDIPWDLPDFVSGDKWVQEVRISSEYEHAFQWLVGGYYSFEDRTFVQDVNWIGSPASEEAFFAALGFFNPALPWFDATVKDSEEQISAFGELSYTVYDQFTLTFGARWTRYDQNTGELQLLANLGGSGVEELSANTETTFTPKVALSWQRNDDELYYFNASRGFRVGATNGAIPADACAADLAAIGLTEAPPGSKSDAVWNYEGGTKLRLFDGRVALDGALFWIDWTDIQTNTVLTTCGFQFGSNGAKAESKGVELEIRANLSDALSVDLAGSFVDATLAADTPANSGLAGLKDDRLPGIPRWNFRGALEYELPTIAGYDGVYFRTDFQYVGGYYARFTDQRNDFQESGDYVQLDLKIGVPLENWVIEVFAENVTDEFINLLTDPEFANGRRTIARPRSVGITTRFNF